MTDDLPRTVDPLVKVARDHPHPLVVRIIKRTTIQDRGYTTPCWINSYAGGDDGYCRISTMRFRDQFGGRKQGVVHRVLYELVVGPVDSELTMDHLCRQPACCNPSHLEPVTRWENVKRGVSPWAKRALQTHCIRGHEFDGTNTKITKQGRRRCRACDAIRHRKNYAPRKVA